MNPFFVRCGLLLVGLACVGCGAKAYEGRLEETRKYFEFLEKQNVNLTKEWKGSGVEMRIPVHFQEIKAPVVKKDKEGNVIEQPPDLRQPPFAEGGFPGLIGAWKTTVNTDKGAVPAYFYILSNFNAWLNETTEEAMNFDTNAINDVMNKLNVGLPPDNQWKTESYPNSTTGYNIQRSFSAAAVTPTIDGKTYVATVYRVKNKDMQILLMTLMPEGAQGPEKKSVVDLSYADRMSLALETFSMSPNKPVKPKKGAGGPPGGPAGGPKF